MKFKHSTRYKSSYEQKVAWLLSQRSLWDTLPHMRKEFNSLNVGTLATLARRAKEDGLYSTKSAPVDVMWSLFAYIGEIRREASRANLGGDRMS